MARPSKALLWAGAAGLALVAVWAWRHYELGALLTLDNLKASRDALQARVQAQPLSTAALFFAVYVAAAALSIPGAVILTLAAGAMFGLGWGLLIVSFASSLGALLAFLVARYLLRDAIQARFGKALAPINEGVAQGRHLLPADAAPGAGVPFLADQPADGPDAHGRRPLLPGQPARHAGRHGGVRERRHPAGGHPVARRHPLARAAGQLRAAGPVPAAGQGRRGLAGSGARCTPSGRSRVLRPQPGGHRRRRGRAGVGLHRRRREGQGDADRKPQDGRRLPELRLRAEQGADPLGQDGAPAEEGA
jgi:hypothetical protein